MLPSVLLLSCVIAFPHNLNALIMEINIKRNNNVSDKELIYYLIKVVKQSAVINKNTV